MNPTKSNIIIFIAFFISCFNAKSATSFTDSNGISYSSTTSEQCYVSTANQSYSGSSEVTIPSMVNDCKVVSITGKAFQNNQAIKTLIISDCQYLKTIGTYSFSGCESLTSIIIRSCPELTTLSNYAFYGCPQLESITISDCNALKIISDHVFADCTSLSSLNLLECTGLKTVGAELFKGCTSLETVYFPESITTIDTDIFSECTALTTVVLYVTDPSSIKLYSNTISDPSVSKAILYVPSGSVDAYKALEAWNNSFVDILSIDDLPKDKVEASEIGLSLEEFTIAIGADPVTVSATVSPEDATDTELTWSVEPSGIIDIENIGNTTHSVAISPLSEGTCVLTVISSDGGSVSSSCNIEVKAIKGITLEAVSGATEGDPDDSTTKNTETGASLIGNDITMRVGQSATLLFTAIPETDYTSEITCEVADGAVVMMKADNDNGNLITFSGSEIGETTYTVKVYGTESVSLSGTIKVIAEIPISSIFINPTEITLPLNSAAFTPEVTLTPTDASIVDLNWYSNDTEIAIVDDNGLITLKNIGKCTVLATTTDGTNISASISITVTSPVAESLEFDFDETVTEYADELSLEIGSSYQFVVKPGNEDSVLPEVLLWSSSDESVATVSASGTVEALSEGETIITVSAEVNGTTVSASCKVTVTAIAIKSITLSNSTLEIVEGNMQSLSVDYQPIDAEPDFLWSVDDDTIILLTKKGGGNQNTSVIVNALKPGKAVVTVYSSSNPEICDKCDITVTEDKTNAIVSAVFNENGKTDIYDLNGRLVLKNVSSDSEEIMKLNPGLYIFRSGESAVKVRIK